MPKFLTDEQMASLEAKEPKKKKFISDDEMTQLEESSKTGKLKTLGLGVLQGGSFGFADELTAMGSSLSGAKGGLKKAATYLGADYADDPDVVKYETEVSAERDIYKKAAEDRPGYFFGGEMVGSIPTMLIPGLQAAKLAKGAKLGKRLWEGSKVGAKAGAAYGAGASEATSTPELAKDIAVGTGMGAALGPAAELGLMGAGKGLKKGVEATKYLSEASPLRGLGTKLGGVSKEALDTMVKHKPEVKATGKKLADPSDEGLLPQLSEAIRKHEVNIDDATLELQRATQKAETAVGAEQKIAKERVEQLSKYVDDLKRERAMSGRAAESEVGAGQREASFQAKQRLNEIKQTEKTLRATALSDNQRLAEHSIRGLTDMSVEIAHLGKNTLNPQKLVGLDKNAFLGKIKSATVGKYDETLQPGMYEPMKSAYTQLETRIKNLPDNLSEVDAKKVLDDVRMNLKQWYAANQPGKFVGSLDLPQDRVTNEASKELLVLLRESNPAYAEFADQSRYLIQLQEAASKKLNPSGVIKSMKDPQSTEASLFKSITQEQTPESLPANMKAEVGELEAISRMSPADKLQQKLQARASAEAPYTPQIENSEMGVNFAKAYANKLDDKWAKQELDKALKDPEAALAFAKDKASAIQAWFPDSAGRSRAAELLQEAFEKNDDTALAALRSIGEDFGPQFQRELDLLKAYIEFHKKGGEGQIANVMALAGRGGASAAGLNPFTGYVAGKGGSSLIGAGRSVAARGLNTAARTMPARAFGGASRGTFSLITQALQMIPDKLGPYSQQLMQASQRGVLPITHYKMMQTDGGYRLLMQQLEEESE